MKESPSLQPPPSTLPPPASAAEEALFQRLLLRLGAYLTSPAGPDRNTHEAGRRAGLVSDPFSGSGSTFSAGSPSAIPMTVGAAAFAGGAVAGLGLVGYLARSRDAARTIVEARKSGEEPVAQVLFRVPDSLRDDLKRLAVDEKRRLDDLLIEATLDLLAKYGRPHAAVQPAEPSRSR